MAETGPLQAVYSQQHPNLLVVNEAAADAAEFYRQAEDALATAKLAVEATSDESRVTGLLLAERIHETAGRLMTVDPLDYLAAVVNAMSKGRLAGDDLAESITPLNTAMIASSIPITVVGSTERVLEVGLSQAGTGIAARRQKPGENGLWAEDSIALELPLINLSGYGSNGNEMLDAPWSFMGGSRLSPFNLGVMQHLQRFSVVNSSAQVAEIAEEAAELRSAKIAHGLSSGQRLEEHERKALSLAELLPVVAYGDEATAAVLRHMKSVNSRRRQAGLNMFSGLDSIDVITAGITLGIPPSEISHLDPEELEAFMSKRFEASVSNYVGTLVSHELIIRTRLLSSPQRRWTVTASPEVRNYLGVNTASMTKMAAFALEKSFNSGRASAFMDTGFRIDQGRKLLADALREDFDLSINAADLIV